MKLVRGEHAVQRIAGYAEKLQVACPRSDEHRVKAHLVDHLFDREQASDERIAFELHAKLPQLLDLRVDHFVEAEIGIP